MAEQCPWCGAVLPENRNCQSIHEELLHVEALHAIPHSLHFLHVTCFLIQHERYSTEGLQWAQAMLRVTLQEGLTGQDHLESLRAAGKKTAAGARGWKFHRAPDAPPLPKIAWSVTIVDVFLKKTDAQSYGELVKLWARATLQDMAAQPL